MYDVQRHVSVVLRIATSSRATLGMVADTIASFSEHASANRREPPAEICARWGGPPFATYELVRKRFRVMVIWDENPGDIDVAHDAHSCFKSLHRSVSKHAAKLASDNDDDNALALAAVYAAAGRALRSEQPVEHEEPSSNTPRKKQSVGTGLRGIFGRSRRADPQEAIPIRSKSRTETSRTEKPQLPPIDDKPSTLALPSQLFDWADFGGPLPPSGGDIAWLANLLRAEETRATVAAPVLKKDPETLALLPSPPTHEQVASLNSQKRQTGDLEASNPKPLSPAPGPPLENLDVSRDDGPPKTASVASPTSPTAAQPVTAHAAPVVTSVPHPVLVPSPVPPANRASCRVDEGPVSVMPSASQAEQVAPPQEDPAAKRVLDAHMGTAPHASTAGEGARIASAAPVMSARIQSVNAGHLNSNVNDFDPSALGSYKDRAALAQTNGDSSGVGSVADPIREMMNEFAKSMKAGRFDIALQQVSTTLRTLATQTPVRMRETATCAHYVLALRILLRVRALDTSGVDVRVQTALLTMFMAELRYLLPTHRGSAMRMAIEKNIVIGNYGMAARWIRQVANTPAQKSALTAKLQMCRQYGESNAHMPPTNKICYSTLVILAPPYAKCGRCPAVYRPQVSGVNVGQRCPTCFAGVIIFAQ